MKATTFIALALALGVAACKYPELPRLTGDAQGTDSGTSDGGTDAPPMGIDAMTDSARTCYLPADLGTLTIGTAAQPVVADWFAVATTGPNAGKKIFTLAGQLGPNAPVNVIDVEVASTAGFMVNNPYAFTATPNTAFTAQSYLLGDYNQQTSAATQMLFASNGSITFTLIGESSNANITGTVAVTNYREVDQSSNANVPGGCTSVLQGIQFYLRQQ